MIADKSFSLHPRRGMQKSVRTALLVLSAVGVLAVVAGIEVFSIAERAIDYQNALARSSDQKTQIRRVASMLQEAETSQRGFLLTNDVEYLEQFQSTREELREPLNGLLDALSDSPEQVARAIRLNELGMTRMRQLSDVLAEVLPSEHALGLSGAIIPSGRADAAMRTRSEIQVVLENMIASEAEQVLDASEALNERIRFSRTLMFLLLALIVLLVTFLVSLGLAYLAHRGRVETELQQSVIGARQASDAKTQFLASMSHEIRTPLTGILGYTELLLDESLAPRQRSYVENLQTAGLSLSALVDDILELSKIEAGEIILVDEPFPLGALVDNVISIVALSARKKGLELHSEIDAALPATVLGDEPRLRQVLLNLLTNAIKFTREGSVTLRVMHRGSSGAAEIIHFEVSDTGIGIPVERQSRLFRRFSQADPSIQHEYGGTGLGLSISKRLVELMDGTIGVKSDEGHGSTFWFTVPFVKSEATADQLPGVGRTERAPGGRILLVEDSPQNQDLVRAILTEQGHHVDVANNGEEGVVAARSEQYDLILMDIQMPRMDGMTATREIRKREGPGVRVPIIAMTANVLPQEIKSFQEAGLDDHFAKPFKKAHLVEKVNQWRSMGGGQLVPASADACAFKRDHQAIDDLRELMGDAWVRESLVRLKHRIDEAFPDSGHDPPDRERLKRLAHRLVSDAGQLGFCELSRVCSALEKACARDAEIDPAVGCARLEAERAKNAADHLLAGIDRP